MKEQDLNNELSPKTAPVISLLPYISSLFFGLIQFFRSNIQKFGYITVYAVSIMTVFQLISAGIYLVLIVLNRNKTIEGKKLICYGYYIAVIMLTVLLCTLGASLGKPYIRDVFSVTQTVSTCFYYDSTKSLYVLDHEEEVSGRLYLTTKQSEYIGSLDISGEEKTFESSSFGTVRSRKQQIDIEYYPNSGIVKNVSEST